MAYYIRNTCTGSLRDFGADTVRLNLNIWLIPEQLGKKFSFEIVFLCFNSRTLCLVLQQKKPDTQVPDSWKYVHTVGRGEGAADA